MEFPEDQKKIQEALREYGVEKTLGECRELWEEFSGDSFATWMTVPDDKELVYRILEDYLYLY